jgi:prepilin-type N-terminal cleavage/methylation domain-containing protein
VHKFRAQMRGFTLIELMVVVAVLAIGLMVAIPSFNETRQRSALRGAADQVVSFWANARFEALKRNQPIKVGLVKSGDSFCMGAAIADDVGDNEACDCFTANACDVATYPASQSEWRRVRAPEVGNNDGDAIVINPKRGAVDDDGLWALRAPSGGPDYQLDVHISVFGRAVTCEPSSAGSKIPQFSNRRC